jgi:hypothetical protein
VEARWCGHVSATRRCARHVLGYHNALACHHCDMRPPSNFTHWCAAFWSGCRYTAERWLCVCDVPRSHRVARLLCAGSAASCRRSALWRAADWNWTVGNAPPRTLAFCLRRRTAMMPPRRCEPCELRPRQNENERTSANYPMFSQASARGASGRLPKGRENAFAGDGTCFSRMRGCITRPPPSSPRTAPGTPTSPRQSIWWASRPHSTPCAAASSP